MRIQKLLLSAVLVAALGFVSCQKETTETKTYLIGFENVPLGSINYWNGSDLSGELKEEPASWDPTVIEKNYYGGFESEVAVFKNKFTPGEYGDSWLGFACSALGDTKTPGIENQYSCIAGSGANMSGKFGLAFGQDATFECPKNEYGYLTIKNILLTNSTYTYCTIKEGNDFSRKFDSGDWFKVSITGYKDAKQTAYVDYYLADFREGKKFISDSWVKVDISALGEVDRVVFTFDSSDKGDYGVNTPMYVCVDNIEFKQEVQK